MVRFVSFFLLTVSLLTGVAHAAPAELPADQDDTYNFLATRLERQIQAMDWGEGRLAILVEDGSLPLRILGQNQETPMQPAGLMQVATAAAALEKLGPQFTFDTELALSGRVEDGQVSGSLVVRGTGDPSLSSMFAKHPDDAWDVFDRWAKLLRKRGVKRLAGSVIGDGRAFDNEWRGPGWPLDDLGSPHQPSISALNFNDNCIDIFWQKGRKPERPAQYILFPALTKYVFFANNVRLSEATQASRHYERNKSSNVISAMGELPIKTLAHDRAAIEDPARFFAEALKQRLGEHKITVTGDAASAYALSPAEVPEDAVSLDKHVSPPLSVLLGQMMRYDLTLHAEVVLKTLGARRSKAPGSFSSGADAVDEYLYRLHLPGARRVVMDGSGRSQFSRLTASQLVGVLRNALQAPTGKEFESLFPHAWEPGILAERFRSTASLAEDKAAAKGKEAKVTRAPEVWAKTGSAKGCETIAGWVKTRSGGRLLFAIMVNDSKAAPDVLRLQLDTLVKEMAESEIEK